LRASYRLRDSFDIRGKGDDLSGIYADPGQNCRSGRPLDEVAARHMRQRTAR
jgi:hypothetical protein